MSNQKQHERESDGGDAHPVELTEDWNWHEAVSVKVRTYFSIQHIQSAALFARCCARNEEAWPSTYNHEIGTDLRAYGTGAVFAATAFLEALINELFEDTVTNPHSNVNQLEAHSRVLMAAMWKLGVPRSASYPVPKKYQIALTLADKQPFEEGRRPYQDVLILVRLRNHLAHYEPAWITEIAGKPPEVVQEPSLAAILRGRFELNTALASAPPDDQYLSHRCAAWAVRSSTAFAEEFCTRMGIEVPFAHVRPRLVTE